MYKRKSKGKKVNVGGKNAKKGKLDELKALKEKGKREAEIEFYAARKE